ncbi:MAG: hypothetical protein WCD44_02125, partial [Candidatus Babeliales bacterium]
IEVKKEGKQAKIIGKYQQFGKNNKPSWIPGSFVFEKQGDHWLIVEADFYRNPLREWFTTLLGILLFPIIAFLPITMLIDCAKRPVRNKTLWVFLLHFFNIAAAIPYYFFIKRKREKIEPHNN